MIYDAHSFDESMMHAQTQNAVVMQKETPSDIFFRTFESVKARQQIDLQAFINRLSRVTAVRSTARCAKFIRIALQAAGAQFVNHPVAASDWGETLEEIGYKQITPAFDQPQKGDIYIIHRTQKHKYGHIAAFTGEQWVSDFKQPSHDVYRDKNVTYSYYRF